MTISDQAFAQMCEEQKKAVQRAYENGVKAGAKAALDTDKMQEIIRGSTYADGYEEGYAYASEGFMHRIYPAVGLALHELYGFDEHKIIAVLEKAHHMAQDSLDGKDLEAELHEKTGLELIRNGGFDLPDDPEEW